MSTADNACPRCGQTGTHVCSLAGGASIAPMPPGFCRDCDELTSGRCSTHTAPPFDTASTGRPLTVGVVVPANGPTANAWVCLSPFAVTCATHPTASQAACAGCMADLRAEVARLTRAASTTVAWAHDELARVEKERDDARAQAAAETARAERVGVAARDRCAWRRCKDCPTPGVCIACERKRERLDEALVAALAIPATDALAQHDAVLLTRLPEFKAAMAAAAERAGEVATDASEALLARVRPVVVAARRAAGFGACVDPRENDCAVAGRPREEWCSTCALRAALAAYDAGEKGPTK